MCCRIVVSPIPYDVLDYLILGGFQPVGSRLMAWKKDLPDGLVWVTRDRDSLEFSIQPAISSMDHHSRVREAGAAMFKIADILAQAANGVITHRSNIDLCASERGSTTAIVASYPDVAFRHDRLCLGFRATFEGRSVEDAAVDAA